MNEIESLFRDCCIYDHGIDDCVIDKDYLLNVHNNNVYNNVIIGYFKRLQKEFDKELSDKSKSLGANPIKDSTINSIEKCNKYFTINRYDYNQVKDFIRTNLCHNKFCNNCKKVKQACRMSRYIKELEPYKENMFHIIFTLPNVCGNDLKSTLKKMSNAFRKLMRFINGTKNLKFIDFNKYGYLGCVRSLEITFKEDSYHPHYHCAFTFTDLDLDYTIENVYSHDFRGIKDIRLFSEFEIILQKLWYMCLNDIKITEDNYNNLELGYSVLCNKFEDNDYAELFKYMTKETDEINNILTYDNFKTLWLSTRALKQIQGYGVFYLISDDDLMSEIDLYYKDIVDFLERDEKPILQLQSPYELLNDEHYKIISRKRVYQFIKLIEKK